MNKVYTHPGQPQMQVEVILASRGANGAPPIYTIRLRYPRIIHGEIMTHRVFSRNARSSRAVPVKTMLLETTTIPFVPWHWGKNQGGMQAGEECDELVLLKTWLEDDATGEWYTDLISHSREEAWLAARDKAVEVAEALMNAHYHKQIPNRLLEPFSWIDTLITATDWANFLHLRDHKDAEPHLQDLARLVKQAIEEAEVQVLQEGEWHMPYVSDADRHHMIVDSGRLAGERYEAVTGTDDHTQWLIRLSASRNARISYAPFDGDPSYEREFERYNQLVTSERVHASPLEHIAKVDKIDVDEYDNVFIWNANLSGNLAPGWVQFRKTVPGECFHG